MTGLLDVDVIRARAKAATPGPWEARHGGYSWVALYGDEDAIPAGESLPSFEPGGSATTADAEFIAAARTDVPALLAALEEARAEARRFRLANREHIDTIDELRTEVEQYRQRVDLASSRDTEMLVAVTNFEVRATALEATLADVRALHTRDRERLAKVEALADEWTEEGDSLIRNCHSGRDVNEGEQMRGCASALRAALATTSEECPDAQH